MHKLASFLQRNSSKDTLTSNIVDDGDESLENIERNDHRNLSIRKQEEFHKMVLEYIDSSDTSNNPSDIYNDETLNCLKWFIKQSQIATSIGKDLKLYLKKALPIFASVYHKYHNQITNYYQFSFVTDQSSDSSFSLFDIDSPHHRNNNDTSNKNVNIKLQLLPNVSKSSINFINIFYDLLTKSNIKMSLSNEIESIVTDLLSVIIALAHISLTNTDKNIWNDINLSLKLFTGICNNLPLQTIAIFQEHHFILFWKKLCDFITYIIENADKQPKMWILSQRLLKIILVLTESNCNKLSQIFIEHQLLNNFKDIFCFLLAKSKVYHTIPHKIHHLICGIIHRILEIINVLLHSTTEASTIHTLCQELGFWKNTKIYLIRIIPIVNFTENISRSNSISGKSRRNSVSSKSRRNSVSSKSRRNSTSSPKRKFVSVHDWINVFRRLIAVSIINGCVQIEHNHNAQRKSSIDSIDEETKSLCHSLMSSIIPRSHYRSVSSSSRSNKIKQNDILTQHIIPIFITVINNHSDKVILLIEILQHLKALLCADDANWEVFIRYNCFDELFASYPMNDNYQCIHRELFQVLKVCIVKYIYYSNNNTYNDLYAMLLRFLKDLQSKVMQSNAVHCIQFIEFFTKCVQSHSYFGHIFYDLKISQSVVKLLTNCNIPTIHLYLHMPSTSPITSPITSSSSSSPMNEDIVFTLNQMQCLFHFLSLITEYHTANCTEMGLHGICTLLSLLKTAKYHKQIFKIISKILNTFNLQEDTSTFAYYCHGIVILLTRILENKDTSIISKIFVMKYLQYIAQEYKQSQHSFCVIQGFSTILSCLECEYTTPCLIDMNNNMDHNMKAMQLIYVENVMLTLLSMARDEPNLTTLLQSPAFIEQFNVQINTLCDSCVEDDIFKELMVQWVIWISLDYIPDSTKDECRITLSADLEHYTVRPFDAAQLQFPTTRQFYYPHFAVIALELLVQCAPKFQQFGLCLFQNFVKRHLNRNRLASVHFIQTLCHHIGIWLNISGEAPWPYMDSFNNKTRELTQISLIPDYIFLLSIVGTASSNSDLKTILSLYQISHNITKKQMKSNSNRHRYPYGALMSDTLLKILHNENSESFIEFEHNYNGYSYFELGSFDTECTLNMMLQIIVLDQPINVWTLKKSKNCYYQCIMNATEMLICIRNNNSLRKIPIQTIAISVGIWECFTFVFNANHNRNRYKLNKSNCLCVDIYLNGEFKECINLANPSFLSSSSSFIIGRHETESSISDTEWKLGNLQLFEKALKAGHISTLYHDKLQLNADGLIYGEDCSMDLIYSLSPKSIHLEKRTLINLMNEQSIECNGDVSICECRSLSVTLLEMGGIPMLFDIIESSLTTYALNRILELIGELIEEQANNKALLLMPLVAVSSHCNSIHVFAYSLKKVIHLADSTTVSILFRLCGFHNDCTRGMIGNTLQRSLFEAVFLDNKSQKIWNSSRMSIETYQYLYKCLCNLVSVHNEKDRLIKYLSNTCCMVIQIITQVDNDEFSINLLNPAIDLLKCLLLKSNNSNQIKLVMDTIIGMKVGADSDTSNKNILRNNKINLLLKMLLDININLKCNKKRIISLKMIVSLLQTPLYTDKMCDNKQDLLTAQYVLLLSTSMFNKDDKEQEEYLLKLRDSGTIMAFIQSLKPFIESKDCAIIIILLHILVGKTMNNQELIHIQQSYSDSSLIETICKDVHHISLPEIFLIILQSKTGQDALMDNIAFICKQILMKIKNWGTGCTLALVLDMTQAIFTLSIADTANNSDNIDCLQFFVNKAIRQLLKTQDDLEWFFVEILFTSVADATRTQWVHFHTMFLQSLLMHITKYISYKTLKQNVVLSTNLPLIFKIVCGCFLSNTFMNTSLLLDTIIAFIIRYSDTGKIPIELFKILNKICICILSQTLVKIAENDVYDALNIILKNKRMVLGTNNKDETFFISLTYSLYKIYNTSSQSTRTLCMKMWEYLIISQQSVLQNVLLSEEEDTMDVYRDGFCKHLLCGQYDEFEKWLSCNQVLMEKIFGTKCLQVFNDEVTCLDREFAISSTSPINNKRRSSTIIECKNINKLRMNRFKKHELRLINNLSRSHIAFQSVVYASKHLKYQLKMFNFISTCNRSVFREPKWSRNQVYGCYHKYPPRLKFKPLIITSNTCSNSNINIQSPKIWPRQSQIPSISSDNGVIRRGTILSQFHQLLDDENCNHDDDGIAMEQNKAKDAQNRAKQRLLSIRNPDFDSFNSKMNPLTKSPKVIYGQFKDFSKSLIMKKRRKRSASLSDLSMSSSKSFSFTYKEANSAHSHKNKKKNPFAHSHSRRHFSCSALPFDGSVKTIEALRKRVVGLYECVEFEFQCLRVYAMAELRGVVVATHNFFYLIQNDSIYDDDDDDEEKDDEEKSDSDVKQAAIRHIEHYKIDWNDIQKVYLRSYIHQEMGIEIIARRGIHFFLILHTDARRRLYDYMISKCRFREYQSLHFEERMNSGLLYTSKCECQKLTSKSNGLLSKRPRNKKNDALKCMETLWMNGLLSNFDYLLYLNEYSGRSFLDVTQYPIFPWVLSDYKSSSIDLNDVSMYRDLSVPMGALNKERARKYVEQFNEWEGRTYHYGTHYSNPAGIFHYLLRIHPYTQQHVELQNGRFDHSDRLFHDLGEMYLHQSKKSFHAVRELSPEFFYFAQFLINGAKYELGKREHDGISVNDVLLPDWCHNNHYIFIEMNRRALESQYVSMNLHKWIDLIFGYKQQGKHAKESQNLFHPLTYCTNFDINSFSDDILKQAAIEQVRSFGQAPKQLFTSPHAQKQMMYGNNNEFDKYPSCNIIYHCFNKLYQISIKMYDATNQEFIDINTTNQQQVIINNNNNNMHIGSIWCDKLPHSEQYLALIGYQRFVQTPIIDFIIRYNVCDGSIRIRNEEKKEHILHGLHTNIISCLAISRDGQTIITGGLDGLLRVWEIKFKSNENDNIESNKHSNDEYSDKYTRLIHIESSISLRFELISSTPTHLAPIRKIVISQEYNLIISVSQCTAIVWDLINLKVIHILKFKEKIGDVSLQQHRFVISYASNICVYSIYGHKIASFEPNNKNNRNDITQLLLPNQNGIILKKTKITFNNKGNTRRQSNLSDLSSSPSMNDSENENENEDQEDQDDGDDDTEYYTSCHVFSGHKNGMIRMWSLVFKTELNCFRLIRIAKLRGHCYPITSLNITGNGNILLSGDANGKLIEWGLSTESLAAFQHLQSQTQTQRQSAVHRRMTGDDNYGDTESGGITAMQRRAQKDEIKSKYQAFQLHFNNVCALQERLQSMQSNKDKESMKEQLLSSLETLKRCKHSLEIAKSSRPKVFCLFDVDLVSFWSMNTVLVKQADSVHFQIMDEINCIVACYDNCGQRVGTVSKEQKMALIILMKEGVWFEGVIGKRINDFEKKIHLTGYTWINKQILLNKLQSTIGLDLCKHHKINFSP